MLIKTVLKKNIRIPSVKTALCGVPLTTACFFIGWTFMIFDAVLAVCFIYMVSEIDYLVEKSITAIVYIHLLVNAIVFVFWLIADSLIVFSVYMHWARTLRRGAIFPLIRMLAELALMAAGSAVLVDQRITDFEFAVAIIVIFVLLFLYVVVQIYYALIMYSVGKVYKQKRVAFRHSSSAFTN